MHPDGSCQTGTEKHTVPFAACSGNLVSDHISCYGLLAGFRRSLLPFVYASNRLGHFGCLFCTSINTDALLSVHGPQAYMSTRTTNRFPVLNIPAGARGTLTSRRGANTQDLLLQVVRPRLQKLWRHGFSWLSINTGPMQGMARALYKRTSLKTTLV